MSNYVHVHKCVSIHRHVGKDWIKQTIVGSVLFPMLISTTVIIINFVAIYYHASRAIPFTAMVRILFELL